MSLKTKIEESRKSIIHIYHSTSVAQGQCYHGPERKMSFLMTSLLSSILLLITTVNSPQFLLKKGANHF